MQPRYIFNGCVRGSWVEPGHELDLGNDRNAMNRQFKNHCLAYEQNA